MHSSASDVLTGRFGLPTEAVSAARIRPVARTVDTIHPGVFYVGLGAYAGLLLGLWVLFVSDAQTVLGLAVCTAYFLMYFGVPVVFLRTRRQPRAAAGAFGDFLRNRVETFGGLMGGWSVLIQVTILPVFLGLGLIAMGVILHLMR